MTEHLPYARVAVPVPLPETLTYEVPEELTELALPGARVRISVGRRKLIGVVMERTDEAPPGIGLKPLLDVVDREPILPEELLELARFVSDYYLAPVGETVRALIPGHLPPWGDRKVWLTDAGAIAPPRGETEGEVIDVLREAGRLSLSELRRRVDRPDVAQAVDRLVNDGRLASGDRRRATGARYRTAVELPPGDLEEQMEACGRSPQGRAVVELLHTLGRPALVSEITDAVGCSDAVVRRLVKLGVLRKFTQVERVSLDRHRLGVRETEPIVLRPDQQAAAGALIEAVEEGTYTSFLLAGMTGSGKTEVYLRAAEKVLARGRSVILLVPEIALVPALARDLAQRFGREVAMLHSSLSARERQQEWERIRSGEARLVLGPRSAVFAPVRDLGLLVVDEEQDTSYKQDSTPRYHGRDVALVRGRETNAVVVVCSATPSLESRLNAQRGKLRRLDLTHRVGHGKLPEGILVDLREEAPRHHPSEVHFSGTLLTELEATFAAGDQVILLRNRRGYAPLVLCRACGEDMRCEACGLPRTLHRREGHLVCHYCGDVLPTPSRCPACHEAALEAIGAGTERVEENFQKLFPDVPIGVLDRDAVRRPGGVAAVLEQFGRGDTQVLLGTQMVSKGHHFPRVALAAVLSADTYLRFPDFRAVERTYDLLVQLAGRAGRGETPGKVVIQTYFPEHYAIRAALEHDDEGFAAEELRFRKVFHYPPYTRMIQLLARDKSRDKAEGEIRRIVRKVYDDPRSRDIRISGPAPAPLERLRNQWRFQLLLRAPSARRLREVVTDALQERPSVDVVVDVDPVELM